MIEGSTSLAALTGTFSLRVPDGRSRKSLTTSRADSTSPSAGTIRSISLAPASVGATLRVVRFSSRTPSRASMRRMASLRLEADLPLSRAASRKPLALTTATKASRS